MHADKHVVGPSEQGSLKEKQQYVMEMICVNRSVLSLQWKIESELVTYALFYRLTRLTAGTSGPAPNCCALLRYFVIKIVRAL